MSKITCIKLEKTLPFYKITSVEEEGFLNAPAAVPGISYNNDPVWP